MIIISNFLVAIAQLISFVLTAYVYLIVGRAILSWVSVDPYNPVVRFIYQVTDPPLMKIRRFVPVMGGLDLSPMVLILIIVFLKSFVVGSLMGLAGGAM